MLSFIRCNATVTKTFDYWHFWKNLFFLKQATEIVYPAVIYKELKSSEIKDWLSHLRWWRNWIKLHLDQTTLCLPVIRNMTGRIALDSEVQLLPCFLSLCFRMFYPVDRQKWSNVPYFPSHFPFFSLLIFFSPVFTTTERRHAFHNN